MPSLNIFLGKFAAVWDKCCESEHTACFRPLPRDTERTSLLELNWNQSHKVTKYALKSARKTPERKSASALL